MNLRSTTARAQASLSNAACDTQKITLLHSGAALLVSLVLTVLNLILSQQINSTGGLAGIGTRSILKVSQSLLSLGSTIALPFWELGFLFAAISFARRDSVTPRNLFAGFRRFGAALRLFLLQALLYSSVAFACMYIASMIFTVMPGFSVAANILLPMMESSATGQLPELDAAATQLLLEATAPMYIIWGVLFAALCIPLSYRFRMAQFSLMDGAPGALASLGLSSRMMRGNRFSLFKLDLHFWWYYAAQVALMVLAYGDMLLAAIGIKLPIDGTVLFLIFYILYLALNLALAWLCKARVQTTYAHCYLLLKKAMPAPTPPQPPVPKQLP